MALRVPIRVDARGRLERSDRVDALLAVIAAMLQTSARPLDGGPSREHAYTAWFGLVETVQGLNWQLAEQDRLAAAINGALRELGIDWARVERIATGSPDHHEGKRPLQIEVKLLDEDRVVSRLVATNEAPNSVGANGLS
jgi:hypothetical protein